MGLYTHPIVLVNTNRFFDPLVALLRHGVEERFMDERHLRMWQIVDTPEQIPQALATAPAWSEEARSFAAVRR